MASSVNHARIRRVFVRGIDAVGDLVLASPVFIKLRRLFPASEIHVYLSPVTAPLMVHCPEVDRVVFYRQSFSPLAFFNDVRRLRRERYDLAVLLTGNIHAALLAALAGIPVRLGYDYDHRRFLLTHPVSESKITGQKGSSERVYRTDKLMYILSPLTDDLTWRQLKLWPGEAARKWARRFAGKRRFKGRGIVIMNPNSRDPDRTWRPERMALLADKLWEKGCRVVLVGAPADAARTARIAALALSPLTDLTGQTGLCELAALCEFASVMVSVDSGPLHIGAAVPGLTVAGLFGLSRADECLPRGRRFLVLHLGMSCAPCEKPPRAGCQYRTAGAVPCMDFDAEEVFRRIEKRCRPRRPRR